MTLNTMILFFRYTLFISSLFILFGVNEPLVFKKLSIRTIAQQVNVLANHVIQIECSCSTTTIHTSIYSIPQHIETIFYPFSVSKYQQVLTRQKNPITIRFNIKVV